VVRVVAGMSETTITEQPPAHPAPTQVDLYWRPGCGYCAGLKRGLDRLGIERVEHDIWENPADAAVVRQHANGNETVPTVVVGDVGLVNPSPAQLVALLAETAPHLLPAGMLAAETAEAEQ
jgi:mycoredoxin